MQPSLHVQNLFDALNLRGTGVNGYLKQPCVQRQNRGVGLANSGEIVAVSADCSGSFIEYMLRTTGVSDVLALRYEVSRDPRTYLDAHSVFESLIHDPQWGIARERYPILNPYVKTPAIYQAAQASGIGVSESEWQTARLTEAMNDKARFYEECQKARIPVPPHSVVRSDAVTDFVIDSLETPRRPLYIRQATSAATVGNITVKRLDSGYSVPELKSRFVSYAEFVQILQEFIRTSFGDEFVIAELLDLYASPGTLYYANDTDVTVICHTYQILDRNHLFLGFAYPIQDDRISKHFQSIEEWVLLLIEPWRQLGYRGYGNIDWMITKEGNAFLAERNARQTAVIPPLKIAGACVASARREHPILAPSLSIITKDVVRLDQPMTFEEVYAKLSHEELLWGQRKESGGIIITIPPSPRFGINTVGIMAAAGNLAVAYRMGSEASRALGTHESELLFELKM